MIDRKDITDEMLMRLADGEGDSDFNVSLRTIVDSSQDLQTRFRVFSETRSALQHDNIESDWNPVTDKLIALHKSLQAKVEYPNDNVVNLPEHRSQRPLYWGVGMLIAASFMVVGIGIGMFVDFQEFPIFGNRLERQIAEVKNRPNQKLDVGKVENIQRVRNENFKTTGSETSPILVKILRALIEAKEGKKPLLLKIDAITHLEIALSSQSECLKFRITNNIEKEQIRPSDWTELCGEFNQ